MGKSSKKRGKPGGRTSKPRQAKGATTTAKKTAATTKRSTRSSTTTKPVTTSEQNQQNPRNLVDISSEDEIEHNYDESTQTVSPVAAVARAPTKTQEEEITLPSTPPPAKKRKANKLAGALKSPPKYTNSPGKKQARNQELPLQSLLASPTTHAASAPVTATLSPVLSPQQIALIGNRRQKKKQEEKYTKEFMEENDRKFLVCKFIGDWRSVGSMTRICFFDHLHTLAVCGCKVSDCDLEWIVLLNYTKATNDTTEEECKKLFKDFKHKHTKEDLLALKRLQVFNEKNSKIYKGEFLSALINAMEGDMPVVEAQEKKYFMPNGRLINADYTQEFKAQHHNTINTYLRMCRRALLFGAMIGFDTHQTKQYFRDEISAIAFSRRYTSLYRLAGYAFQVKCTNKEISATTCRRQGINEEHIEELNMLATPYAEKSLFHRTLVQFQIVHRWKRKGAQRHSNSTSFMFRIGLNLYGKEQFNYSPPKGFTTDHALEDKNFSLNCAMLITILCGRISTKGRDALTNKKSAAEQQAELAQLAEQHRRNQKTAAREKDDADYQPSDEDTSTKKSNRSRSTGRSTSRSKQRGSSNSNKKTSSKSSQRSNPFASNAQNASMPTLQAATEEETTQQIVLRTIRHYDNGVVKIRKRLGKYRPLTTIGEADIQRVLSQIQPHAPTPGLPFNLSLVFEIGFKPNSLKKSTKKFSICSSRTERSKVQSAVVLNTSYANFYLAAHLDQWYHGQVPTWMAEEIHKKSAKAPYKCASISHPVHPENWTLEEFKQDIAQNKAQVDPIRALYPGHPLYDDAFEGLHFNPVEVTNWVFNQYSTKKLKKLQKRLCTTSVDLGFGNRYSDWAADDKEREEQLLAEPDEMRLNLEFPHNIRIMFGLMLTKLQYATKTLCANDDQLFYNTERRQRFAETLQKRFPGDYDWEAFTILVTEAPVAPPPKQQQGNSVAAHASQQQQQQPQQEEEEDGSDDEIPPQTDEKEEQEDEEEAQEEGEEEDQEHPSNGNNQDVGILLRHLDRSNDSRRGYENTAIWNTVFEHSDKNIYRLSFIAHTRSLIGSYMDKCNGHVKKCKSKFDEYLLNPSKENPVELKDWKYTQEPDEKWGHPKHRKLRHLRILRMRPFKDRCAHHSSFAYCIRKVTKQFALPTMQVCQLLCMSVLLPNPSTFWQITTSWCETSKEYFQERLDRSKSVFKLFYDDVAKLYGLSDSGNVRMNTGDPARVQPSCNDTWEHFFSDDIDKNNKRSKLEQVQTVMKDVTECIVDDDAIPIEEEGEADQDHTEHTRRSNLPSSRWLGHSWNPPRHRMNIEMCAYRLMKFFQILNDVEDTFDELTVSVVEHILKLNLHGIGELKAGAFLEIAVLCKLIPPCYIRCVSWNLNASYKKLAKLGCTKDKNYKTKTNPKLDIVKLRELGRSLAIVCKMPLKEVENILCETWKEKPGTDVVFWGQFLYHAQNIGNMNSKEEEVWILNKFDPIKGEWEEDLEEMKYDFTTPEDYLVESEAPNYNQMKSHKINDRD